MDDEADDTMLVLNEQDSSTAEPTNTIIEIETKDHIDKMQVSSASDDDDVYETKECKKEDLDRAGAAAASAAAAVEHVSKAKAALARTVDILISTKKKVKFTQIHGSSFSIADGELTIKGQKVVSDAKRTEILDKGSFLQKVYTNRTNHELMNVYECFES